MNLIVNLLDDAFFSALPAVGFAMLFHVPARLLGYCAIGGAIGHASRSLLMHYGVTIELATLCAATLIGMIAVYWSRRLLVPRPVFTVASIIPMIPGTFAFKTVIGIFNLHTQGYSEEIMANILQNGLTTLFVLLAISVGLAIPSVVFFRKKPIV